MTYTITQDVTLVTHECGSCGVLFAMPVKLKEECLRDQSRSFYCPNGHGRHFVGKTEEQRLREQLDRTLARERAARDQLEAAERSRAALKGVVTKTKKRVGNGVCPCCNRTFQNLARHMGTKHPDYATEAVGP